MAPYRGFIVWGSGIVVVLGTFLIFMAAGWPGGPDSCVNLKDPAENTCFCEAFDNADVLNNRPGVRQPVNTWFNLYAILTSLLVATHLYFDRKKGGAQKNNIMRSNSWIPDLYVFAMLFLGLGSMWLHASLTAAVSWVDGFSMYVFATFLVFYTLLRLHGNELIFWIGYPAVVALFTVISALWTWEYASAVLIGILVFAYLQLEMILWCKGHGFVRGKPVTILLWGCAVLAIITATIFWILSQTDGLICEPDSPFQAHGMLWHPLAGAMALLLYYYWRYEENA